jgi:ribose transport system permease protein
MGTAASALANGIGSSPARLLGRNWSLVFLALMLIVFSLTGTNFFALANFQNIVHLATVPLLLAAAETFVIITGGIDLSVGFVMGLAWVSAAATMQALHAAAWPQPASVAAGAVVGLATSAACGLASGTLVARWRVPAFIATLGILGVANGVTLRICGGFPVGFLPPSITEIGNGYLAYHHPATGAWSLFGRPPGIAESRIKELVRLVPNSLVLAAAATAALWHLLRNTRFGRHTYAIGGGMDAAVRSGIGTRRHLTLVYLLSGLLAGLAGVFNVFQTGIGNYTPFGANYEMFAVAAVIIGGASLTGGKGRIMASAIGVLVLEVLENGLTLSGV